MSCEKCKDTAGFILTELADGRTGAEKCDCSTIGYQETVKGRANIPEAYQTAALDNFKLPENNPIARSHFATAANDVRTYIREFPMVSPSGLLFIGPTGTGKTHLAVATLRGLLDRGFEGVFFNFSKLLDHIRSGWKPDAGTMDRAAYSLAEETPILVLDDLGAHRVVEWVQDIIESIITHRCNHRKALIATTNLPDPDVTGGIVAYTGAGGIPVHKQNLAECIGMRARSRLFEMCRVIWMPAVQDYRVQHGKVVKL